MTDLERDCLNLLHRLCCDRGVIIHATCCEDSRDELMKLCQNHNVHHQTPDGSWTVENVKVTVHEPHHPLGTEVGGKPS